MFDLIVAALDAFFGRAPLEVGRDLLDIGIVAFVFYRVVLLVKGTRAMQMGVGLALVFIAYQVANRLHLITLYTILNTMLTYFVLLIVVVFQSDIRRALVRVGMSPLFRSGRTQREGHAIEEVLRAAGGLGQRRIGALIVFERDAVLDDFIEQGTLLDCEVSKEILHSIFVPSFENPMHDGAVIIRDGRIWQAGSFLPLAANPKLDRALGTRHRAALGISEETDAVVVVVSEERGEVSLCFGGNIVRDLDTHSLREALLGLFRGGPVKRPSRVGGRRTSIIPPAAAGSTSRGRTSSASGPPPSTSVQGSVDALGPKESTSTVLPPNQPTAASDIKEVMK